MAAPAPYLPGSPATTARPSRRGRGVVGPLLLIFLGSVFLLQNMGVVPPDTWTNLWRLWPLVLVVFGVELLFGSRLHWLALTGLVVVLFAAGLVASGSMAPMGAVESRSFENERAGAQRADVTVRFGAGQLALGPLTDNQDRLLGTMRYEGQGDFMPEARSRVDGTVARLEYTLSGRGSMFGPFGGRSGAPRMDVELSPSVPLTLTVQTGAADATLDLTRLQLSNLDLSTGAASSTIRLPQAAGTSTVHISGGAATITLEVPREVAASIRHRGGLSALTVDESRFPKVNDQVYRSPDFDTARNKVDIVLETGVATIRVT
jgi:hypothetical protein